MWRRAVLLVAAAVLVGCGDGSDPPEARPAGNDVELAAFGRTAETVTGEQVELAAYADRDLVVWFWAPW